MFTLFTLLFEDFSTKHLVGIGGYWFAKKDVERHKGFYSAKIGAIPIYATRNGKTIPFKPTEKNLKKAVQSFDSGKPINTTITPTDSQKIEKVGGTSQFVKDLSTTMHLIGTDDPNAEKSARDLVSKYNIQKASRAAGMQFYTYAKNSDGNYLSGSRKPLGETASGLSEKVIATLLSATSIPEIEQKFIIPGAVLTFSPTRVFNKLPGDPIATIENNKIVNGKFQKSIVIGNYKISKIEITDELKSSLKLKPNADTILEMIEYQNMQFTALESLFDKKNTFKGIIIDANDKRSALDRLANDMITAMENVKATEHRKLEFKKIIENIRDPNSQFDKIHSDIIQFSGKVNDDFKASIPYLSEMLSIYHEILHKKGLIIVPTSSSFKVSDFIFLSNNKKYDQFIDVSIDMVSVKLEKGGESGLLEKVKLTTYNNSRYGTGEEIKQLLETLVSSDENSLYDKLFRRKNHEYVEKQLDILFSKYKKLICNYYNISPIHFTELREQMRKGRAPIVKNGKIIPREKAIPVMLKPTADFKAWELYCEIGFLADIINNTHLRHQAFINHTHTEHEIKMTDGGWGKERIVGISKFRADKREYILPNGEVTPRTKYASYVIITPESQIPARV